MSALSTGINKIYYIVQKYKENKSIDILLKGLLYFYAPFIAANHTNHESYELFLRFIKLDSNNLPPQIEQFINLFSVNYSCSETDDYRLYNLYIDILLIKKLVQDDEVFSMVYELSLDKHNRKSKGIYYTPRAIIDFIVDKLMEDIDVVSNPYFKIMDPSCGCGNFLSRIYDRLLIKYTDNLFELKTTYGSYWCEEYIKSHIINHNLYGSDIDYIALSICKLRLGIKYGTFNIYLKNIVQCNSLVRYETANECLESENTFMIIWSQKYDYIIGNPPYQNMQKADEDTKLYVELNYRDIYNGQNDLYYYFIYRAIEKLKDGGTLGFIIPPYFISSTYGAKLRKFINNNMEILYMEDMSRTKIFHKTEIHSCIFIGTKKESKEIQLDSKNINIKANGLSIRDDIKWIFADCEAIKIVDKLNTFKRLHDYAYICKGMDTGLNKCFLINDTVATTYNLEVELLKPVVRSSDINRYKIREPHSSILLYLTNDTEIKSYPYAYNYLMQFYEELSQRWGYKKCMCHWYSISTLRNNKCFDSDKMRIFAPYRCKTNNFAIDYKFSIGLTDTTVIFPKEDRNIYYLTGILNSKLIFFYNSICGKRKGRIYEFFSGPVSNFPIAMKTNTLFEEVVDNVLKIMKLESCNDNCSQHQVTDIRSKIDSIIFSIYGLDDTQIRVIDEYISKVI